MTAILFLKTHVDAYTRADGVHVRAHDRRPMYVSRKVLNGDEVHDWAVRQGFKHVVPPDKMHLTVAYSRAPVHHESVEPDQGTLMAAPLHLGRLGDEGAHVLHVDHPRLQARFDHMMSLGASWDHDGGKHYKPHITISYKPQGADLTHLPPFDGEVHLGPEVVEDLKSGWGGALVTKSMALFTKSRVGAYMRNGKLVNLGGYEGRQARAVPAAAGQMTLFTAEEAPPPPAKPNPFKGKDPVLDTPDLFTGRTRREEPTEGAADLAAEHRRLVAVLRSPSHADDKAEADRQEKELKGYEEQAAAEAGQKESDKLLRRPKANGADFGMLYHGTPLPFDEFRDPTDGGRDRGAGYDHQGPGVYLTDDPHGYGRFFARESGAKLALRMMVDGKKKEAEKISDGNGHVLHVKLSPDARILHLQDAPAHVRSLFDHSVGNPDVAKELRETVTKLGYDGLAFEEPNHPEGWQTKAGAKTVVVYNHEATKIEGHRPGEDYDLPSEHPYWGGKAGPDPDAKHPLAEAHRKFVRARDKYAAAHRGGDEKEIGFRRMILEQTSERSKKLGDAFRAFHETGDGTELSDKDGKRHAVLLPDASNPGKYRYQMFDDRGFSAHSTHDTPEDAVADAVSAGYHVPNPGVLDRLAGTDEWAHGMAVNAVMQAHNSGQIDWRTAMDRIKDLVDERDAKKAAAAPAPEPEHVDDHPSKPTRSLLNLVPEDRRDEWMGLHRQQHELHHYDLGQSRERLERARGPMRRAESKMREAEAVAREVRKGGDLPGTDERVRDADAAVARHRAEFEKHRAKVDSEAAMHQSLYERVAKLGRQKESIASATGDMNIDWASMKKRTDEEQRKYEASQLKAYRDYYKRQAQPLAKAWDWLGTEPVLGQQSILFLRG